MDIEGIRLFVKAADMLNISAAGRALGLAPAVASSRLSKLEKQVGADLLHRSTRKISISQVGEEFLPYAREILAQENAAMAALGHKSAEVTGTLRFAASSTFSQLYIAPILPEFLERYPQINIQLILTDTQMNLIEGGFDLALRNYAIEDSSLMGRKIANDKRILCASPEYLKRYGTPEEPDDLAEHHLLVFMDGAMKELVSNIGGRVCKFPHPDARQRVSCDDGTTMRLATQAGVGISMNSLWSVYQELQTGALTRVLPDYEVEDNSAIWLVYPKSNVLTAKVRVFIDFVIEKIGQPAIWNAEH